MDMLISSILLMAMFLAWLVINDLFREKLRTETKVLGYTMITISVFALLYLQVKILFL